MRLLIPAILTIALAGCMQPEAPRMELDPEQAVLDDVVEWQVRLHLEERFTYMHPGCGPELFELTVATPNGTVPLYEYGKEALFGPCVVTEKSLPAGTHEETFHWNGHAKADQPDEHDGERVPEGSYTLTARLRGTNITAQGVVAVTAR